MALKTFIFLLLIVKSYGLYANSSVIVTLNTDNFDKLVKNGEEIWLVEFFAPWCKHCQNFAEEYERAAIAFAGIVKVGAVNAEDNPALSEQYGIQEYPTIKIFNSHKGVPEVYQGEHTTSALVSFISVEIHSKINSRLDGNLDPSMFQSEETVELNETNFDELVLSSRQMWLVVYFSPFSKQCKKLSAQWTKVAAELKGMIKMGALDANIHFSKAADCKIEGYPSIKFFSLGKKKVTSGITYSGKQKSEAIIDWALDKISENALAPKIKQIVDFDSLKRACENKPLCIVSILPHILDCQSKCRNEYLEILTKLGENYKKALWGWVWSEAGAQPAIESALEIDSNEQPTIVAIHVRQMWYSVLGGSLTFDTVNEFLRDLSYGRGEKKTIKIKKVPEILEIEPWDELDVKPASIPSTEETDSDNVDEMKDEL